MMTVVALGGVTQLKAAPAWKDGPGYRSASLEVDGQGRTGFSLLPPSMTGLVFTNALAQQKHLTNQILLNGSGVALGDVDGDGLCDVYLCALDASNRLYRNLGGWKFKDITATAGVGLDGMNSSGAVLADLNGDGKLDLIVNTVGTGTHIFYNQDGTRFKQMTVKAGINPGQGGSSLTLGDIDGDGFLDLYVANYRSSALMDRPNTHFTFKQVDGRKIVDRVNGTPATLPGLKDRFTVNDQGGIQEQGEKDVLYRNLGGTNFFRIGFLGGAFLDEDGQPLKEPPFDWGLCATFRDLNGDGLPDLYVCNDFDSLDRIWINQQGRRFQAISRLALRKSSLFSMGADFADINRDGYDEIFVLDMMGRDRVQRMDTQTDLRPHVPEVGELDNRPSYMMNTLFLNRGDQTYAEVAQYAGVEASDWAWTPVFLDVDLDGWEDLLVSNGNERTARSRDMAAQMRVRREREKLSPQQILDLRRLYPRHDTPNLAFHNQKDLTFQESGQAWGFDLKGVSNGMALGDLDGDGDLDVVVNNLNDPVAVYRNNSGAPRLAVRLQGNSPNTHGVGASIHLRGGPVDQQQQMVSGGRYLSGDDSMKVFAAGPTSKPMTLEVRWRTGRRSLITNVTANTIYLVKESSTVEGEEKGVRDDPLFLDVSSELKHVHQDEFFDDHARQVMLPRRLSQMGPGVGWVDMDGDGHEDLVVGTGRGGKPGFFKNSGKGKFTADPSMDWGTAADRDMTTILGWNAPGKGPVLLAGGSSYELANAAGSAFHQFAPETKTWNAAGPLALASGGAMSAADVDGDGDLDLFWGGGSQGGRYPIAVPSRLFLQENGKWVEAPEQEAWTQGLGLVNGSLFSDLDGDGDPDLVLACDWGPVRVLENEGGQFKDSTARLGLDKYRGWWNGVASGDFDEDGRMDLIVSNWGRNNSYGMYFTMTDHPLRLHYGDWDDNGMWDLVESYFDNEIGNWVTVKDLDFLVKGLPYLFGQFTSYQTFGRSSLQETLGGVLDGTPPLEVGWLESTLFLNRPDGFVARPLPQEAQLTAAFGVAVGDADGDGHEDLFLAQNFFANLPGIPREDSGRGLWLIGDGQGGFRPLSGQESGIKIYGEQRGCALGDYNEDGRVDLVVGQNGGETRLFRNRRARVGLRVQVEGSEGNPLGIGTQLCLADETGKRGPVREIQLGSGFWSQNGAVQVLGRNRSHPPSQILVRWPGQKTFETRAIPPGKVFLRLRQDPAPR